MGWPLYRGVTLLGLRVPGLNGENWNADLGIAVEHVNFIVIDVNQRLNLWGWRNGIVERPDPPRILGRDLWAEDCEQSNAETSANSDKQCFHGIKLGDGVVKVYRCLCRCRHRVPGRWLRS